MQDVEAVAYEPRLTDAEPGEGGGLFDLLGIVGCPHMAPSEEMHYGYALGEVGAFEMHFHVTPLSRVRCPQGIPD